VRLKYLTKSIHAQNRLADLIEVEKNAISEAEAVIKERENAVIKGAYTDQEIAVAKNEIERRMGTIRRLDAIVCSLMDIGQDSLVTVEEEICQGY
jgi:hypothetical protein